jgi:recombination protein RecT
MAKKDGNDVAVKIRKNGKMMTVSDFLNDMKPQIKNALPTHLKPERFFRIALTLWNNPANDKLRACEPMSFIAALMTGLQLGLEPNTPLGQAYLIPYGGYVQFQLGYRGMLALAYRTNEYEAIYAESVYPDDDFSYELGLNKKLIHRPSDDPEGEPKGYYAVYRLKNGGYDFTYWSRMRVERHMKKYSKSYKSNDSAWVTAFDAMAKKTVLKQLLKTAPLSVELVEQFSHDYAIRNRLSDDMADVPALGDVVKDVEATGLNIEAEAEESGEPEDGGNHEKAKEKIGKVFGKDKAKKNDGKKEENDEPEIPEEDFDDFEQEYDDGKLL